MALVAKKRIHKSKHFRVNAGRSAKSGKAVFQIVLVPPANPKLPKAMNVGEQKRVRIATELRAMADAIEKNPPIT